MRHTNVKVFGQSFSDAYISKVPASYLVWTNPKGLALLECNSAPGSGPRVGPEVILGSEVNI